MPRQILAAPAFARHLASDPSLAMPPPRTDVDGALGVAELSGAMSLDWSLERLLDRLEGRR